MVGVAGRSKGCANCRRRRIKCDLGQPACRRCIKADLKCGGSRDITFVHYEQQNPNGVISRPGGSSRQGSSLVLAGTQSRSLLGPMLTIPQNELFLNYTRTNLFQDLVADDTKAHSIPGIDHRLGDASFLALATIFFGTEHRDTAVVRRGLREYSCLIQEINAALADGLKCQSSDVFDAIVTMVLLEFHILERDRGWVSHACGLERLMELRGPATFMSLPDLILLEQARLPVIFAALTLRQPTILSNPQWKYIPWTHFPDRKTSMQKLLDIFADCPALLATSTAIASNDSESRVFETLRGLTIATKRVLQDLDEFEEAWTSTNMAYIWEIPSPGLTPPIINAQGEEVTLWSTVFYYQSLGHANIAMMGSAIRILLLIIYRDIPCSMSNIDRAEVSAQLTTAIMTICRGVDYQFQEIKKGSSIHSLFYPIKMALKGSFGDNPALGNWLKGIMDQLSSGFAGKWNMAGMNPR